MRILMQNRPGFDWLPAGDSVQMEQTREALQALGVEVVISTGLAPDLSGFDLVHLFNITCLNYTYPQAMNAASKGKKFVISPVYWSFDEFIQKEQYNAAVSPAAWKSAAPYRRELLLMASVVLPNARSEMAAIIRDHDTGPLRHVVVPNAVEGRFGFGDPRWFLSNFESLWRKEKRRLKDYDPDFPGGNSATLSHRVRRMVEQGEFVLCVARISSRKNQLSLITAMQGLGIPLVCAGDVNEPHYLRACLREEGDVPVFFIGALPREMLPSVYASARVHALPSWFDTPGLASLEAGLAGCNLVVSSRGTAAEYFGDLAWYCDPADTGSIRRALVQALESGRRQELSRHISAHFTWERAASKTLEGYRLALDANGY